MADLLSKIVDRGQFAVENGASCWQEAVKISALPLVKTGFVTENYYQQIVDCIEKYGPYVVFDHGVAMPHTTENAEGVIHTGVGLTIFKNEISFGKDEEGTEKKASLFFTLAAESPEEHMSNIQSLIGIFTNEELLDALKKCSTGEEIKAAEAAFPCAEF